LAESIKLPLLETPIKLKIWKRKKSGKGVGNNLKMETKDRIRLVRRKCFKRSWLQREQCGTSSPDCEPVDKGGSLVATAESLGETGVRTIMATGDCR
jgi:hypothetical protein